MYRCEAATAVGFVQQLACGYLQHGYHNYVVGEIPEGKDLRAVDARMVERFELETSRATRARRKLRGLANCQYLRYRRFFVLCATDPVGEHEFFKVHSAGQVRHIKDHPIAFAGYSIGYHRGVDRKWHVSIRIHPERYQDVKALLVDIATKRSREQLVAEFRRLPFEPYAPVRRQLLNILRAVNRERVVAGLDQVTQADLNAAWQVGPGRRERWLTRRVVRPFGDDPMGDQAAA